MKQEKTYLFDKPRNVRRLFRAFYAVCAFVLLLDFFYHRHVSHSWEGWLGFYALFGFVACVVLVLVAKQLRKILMRSEDYYRHGAGDGDGT